MITVREINLEFCVQACRLEEKIRHPCHVFFFFICELGNVALGSQKQGMSSGMFSVSLREEDTVSVFNWIGYRSGRRIVL